MIGNLTDQEVAGLREVLTALGPVGNKTIDGTLRVTGGLGVFGEPPPTVKPAVTDIVGGAVVDVQARAAINSLFVALRAMGLIAPPEL